MPCKDERKQCRLKAGNVVKASHLAQIFEVIAFRTGGSSGGAALWCAGKPRGWLHVQFEEEAAVERACRLTGAQLLDRAVFVDGPRAQPKPDPGKPVEGCWFCLSNPTADTQLIVSIGKTLHRSLSLSSSSFFFFFASSLPLLLHTKADSRHDLCSSNEVTCLKCVAEVHLGGWGGEGGGGKVHQAPAWGGKGGVCPLALCMVWGGVVGSIRPLYGSNVTYLCRLARLGVEAKATEPCLDICCLFWQLTHRSQMPQVCCRRSARAIMSIVSMMTMQK